MKYSVTYQTLTDTYVKEFKTVEEALSFCEMIAKLYPGQKVSPQKIWSRS